MVHSNILVLDKKQLNHDRKLQFKKLQTGEKHFAGLCHAGFQKKKKKE